MNEQEKEVFRKNASANVLTAMVFQFLLVSAVGASFVVTSFYSDWSTLMNWTARVGGVALIVFGVFSVKQAKKEYRNRI